MKAGLTGVSDCSETVYCIEVDFKPPKNPVISFNDISKSHVIFTFYINPFFTFF